MSRGRSNQGPTTEENTATSGRTSQGPPAATSGRSGQGPTAEENGGGWIKKKTTGSHIHVECLEAENSGVYCITALHMFVVVFFRFETIFFSADLSSRLQI